MDYDWEEWRDTLNDMLLDPAYEYADSTLQGIRKWVIDNEYITESQVDAITNIQEAAQR